ncbi:MAG TPA: hypothetical protein VJ124_17230 [Pyrinomonadaceae bacterium]|nr:hypothetical protein [Pyrinomonadaceae bacterium]
MKFKGLNWQIWAGFLLSFVAFVSYPFVFVRFPATRDFPWANLLLFLLAVVLVFIGVRRAFAPERRRRLKVLTTLLATLSGLILAAFIFTFFIAARWLPTSRGAPHVGQKAPGFSLSDTNGRQVSLAELLSSPVKGRPPRGVLLVFYRGYW